MRAELVEALGADLLVHASISDKTLVMRVPATTAVKTGQQITAGFEKSSLHWFNAQTTQRIEFS